MAVARIIAKGFRNGREMLVEVIDGKTYINNEKNQMYDVLIKEQHPIGGTYYAESESMTNMLNTLTHHFFDNKPEIITSGEFEQIPHEENVIY